MRIRRLILTISGIGLLMGLTMFLKEVRNDMITASNNRAFASDNLITGIPLIDAEAPLQIETATFALG